MNFKNELTVDKKDGVQASYVPYIFSFKKTDKDFNIQKKSGGHMVIETNEHLINVSFNRDIS